MTKLTQWLCGVSLFLGIWITLVTESAPVNIPHKLKDIIWALPVYLLIAFACYSIAVIGYRVITFNDCVEAAEELRQEIAEARKDLSKKGIQFS